MRVKQYENFAEFWPDYVRAHRHPTTRKLHFVGTTNLIVWLLAAAVYRSPKLLLVAVVSSYTLAWVGHFFIEENIPLTFQYPVKAALGDLLMYMKIWQGKMDTEVARHNQVGA